MKLPALLLLASLLSPPPAGAEPSAAAEFDPSTRVAALRCPRPVVWECRQGGKVLLSGVVATATAAVDLIKGPKAGEFELSLHPLAWDRGVSAGKQGTGLGDFLDPRGVAVDGGGRLAVADAGNDRVQVLGPSLLPLFEFGGFNWQERMSSRNTLSDGARGAFNGPADCAFTIRDLYVTDRENHRVQKFDRDGNFLLSFSGGTIARGRLTFPSGIAADRMGNVYVVDSRNDRVVKCDGNGNFVFEVGGFGDGEGRFNGPRDVAVDGADRIHVLDGGNRRVQSFDRYGHFLSAFPLPPEGDFDSLAPVLDEAIALSDAKGGRVLVVSRAGEPVAALGGLAGPRGLAADERGNLFVVESGACRVVRYDRDAGRARFRFRID